MRQNYELEFPISFPFAKNITVNLGASYIKENVSKYYAYSVYPGYRFEYSIPSIGMKFSAYGRYMRYKKNNVPKKDRLSYGVRGDLGFSVFTGYLAVGKDYGYTNNNKFEDDILIKTGLSLSYAFW